MGLISTLIYTSELILCSTIYVHSATRHNIHLCTLTFSSPRKKDIEDLKEGINFTGQQLNNKTEALERTHLCNSISRADNQMPKNEDLLGEIHTKNLYLESYSCQRISNSRT